MLSIDKKIYTVNIYTSPYSILEIISKFFTQIVIISILIFFGFSLCNAAPNEIKDPLGTYTDTLTVMSYNIRFNNPDDGVNAWPNRKDKVAEMLGTQYEADISGLQEVLIGQIKDLEERLPKYKWTGVGRDNSKNGGEFSPIFYRKDRFELLQEDTFWLSKSPKEPGSKSWDAAITRIVTWAKFKDRETGREFFVFNTHFDHKGRQARLESAKLLSKKIPEIAGENPAVLMGDFNANENSEPYSVITENLNFKDARYASEADHKGPVSTFSNDWKEVDGSENRIDYVFVGNGIKVVSHCILDDRYDGRFPSDHLPVLTDIQMF